MENRNTETERKFLVSSDDFKAEAFRKTRIVQGYLSSVPERTVRVRIKGGKGFLTIKGVPAGITRFEWEREIPLDDAEELMKLCETGVIDKIRYEIRTGRFTLEVDEFFGDNLGLILAEIELDSPDDVFEKPDWIGEEVSGDNKYYNSNLVRNPYRNW